MCYHHEETWSKDSLRRPDTAALADLRLRLAETEARLARARAREAALTRRLHDMKRFVSVMEILETYLTRRYREKLHLLSGLLSNLRPSDSL